MEGIIYGNAFYVLASYPRPQSVDCIVTSPPYFGSRVYNDGDPDPAEIGLGSLDEYLADLCSVFAQCHRLLADDGLLWINIGDTAAGSGGAGGDYNAGGSKNGRPKYKQGHTGLAAPQWCMVPQRLALMLQEDGWLVRHWITWAKTTSRGKNLVRPEDVRHVRRPMVSSEVILMLAKQRSHRFCPRPEYENGNVWHFGVERNSDHHAPYPIELPTRCIKYTLADDEMAGATVLDPFSGSGTTLRAAEALGVGTRVGIDLYH